MTPRSKPYSCQGCPCHAHGTDFSQPEGTGSLGVLALAEASGESEARDELPLRPYAAAGSLYERTLRRMGLDRQQLTTSNILRCFAEDTNVEAIGVKYGYRRRYDGIFVVVQTASGYPLSGTPNHPVLTSHGWVPLGEIVEGDYLVRSLLGEWMPLGNPHVNQMTASIRDVFDSLTQFTVSQRVVGRDVDFHGDGMQSEVEIVGQEGFLWGEMQASSLEPSSQLLLKGTREHFRELDSLCSGFSCSKRLLRMDSLAPHRSVGGLSQSTSLIGSSTSQSNAHGVAAISEDDARPPDHLAERLGRYLGLSGQRLQAFACNVSFAEVIQVNRRNFFGHVYNLHTQDEIYTASGYIVHNCRPKNNWLSGAPWEHSAIAHCRPNLNQLIADRRPRAIFAMGDVALRETTGQAGEARGVSHLRGYVLPSQLQHQPRWIPCECVEGGKPAEHNCFLCSGEGKLMDGTVADDKPIPVVPSFHPAYIRRGKASHQGLFARDLQRAVNVAAARDKQYIWDLEEARRNGTIKYQTHPSIDDARAFRNLVLGNRDLVLSYDLETYESASLDEDARDGFQDTRIRLVQFSVAAGSGIAMPWSNGYREIVADILHAPNLKVGHNIWLFDNKVLRAVGEREGLDLTPRGTCHDTLAAFHHWQPDLPAHLQFAASFANFPFPWKHLAGTDLEFYGCVDVDATWRLYAMLRATMERDQIWGNDTIGYVGQVYSVRPVLAAMEDRGLPVDDAARQRLGEEFDHEQARLTAELDARFPDDARSIHPKDGYKKTPKDTTGLVERDFTIPVVDESTGEPTTVVVRRWCRLEPFSPNSGPQLIRYMKSKGHKVPKSKEEREDGTAKDTTSKKELVRLAAKVHDDFYLKVIECRELGKAKGTYIEGFKPHADGRVHTTFLFSTGTGQLASRNPNITNFMKHGRLAKATRAVIAAPDGFLLSEWDKKSYHVMTTGFEAESPNYMRLARLDMHSFVAGHILGTWDATKIISESDDSLMERFRWLKSDPERKRVRDRQAKVAILGVGFGMGYRRLYQENLENFENEKQAKRTLEVIQHLFPEVFAWQTRIRHKAHEQTFLMSRFGHIRRFYEVFRWDSKKGGWTPGDQADEAVAFLPANHAFGDMRLLLRRLEESGLAAKYGLVNSIHDSFCFAYPKELHEEHVVEIGRLLRSPSQILKHPALAPHGLVVEVEAQYGLNWSAMSAIEMAREATV